jgi:hypothetical protein
MNASCSRLLIVLCVSLTAVVAAQQREREPARGVGKLTGLAPGVIQMETSKGEKWLVAIEGRTPDISFQASATPAFVQAGMLVQFRAQLDKKGEAQDQITQVKVISQRMGIQVGVQADGGFTGDDLFASNDEEGGKKKKKVRADASPYLVTGAVRSIKDGKMYVAAGATVKAELSDNCKVDVDISDIRLAREGDSVEINEGWRYPNQPNQVYARRLTITAEKPLGVDEKKRRPTTKGDDKKTEEKKTDEKKKEKSPAEGEKDKS